MIEEFIKAIYQNYQGIALIMTVIRENSHNRASTRPFNYPDELPQLVQFVKDMDKGNVDIYANMSLFKALENETKWEVRATKEHSIGCPVMWIDSDACPPSSLSVRPQITLETSPDSFQAFWPLTRILEPKEAEDIAKRLAYAHVPNGADTGWQCNKYMRIPGTHNNKPERVDRPLVKILDFDPTPVDPDVFRDLPTVEESKQPEPKTWEFIGSGTKYKINLPYDPLPPLPNGATYPADLYKMWNVRELDDRSEWAYAMVKGLYQMGLPDQVIEAAMSKHPIYLDKAISKWGGQQSEIQKDIKNMLSSLRSHGVPPRMNGVFGRSLPSPNDITKTPEEEVYISVLSGKMPKLQAQQKKMMTVEDVRNMTQCGWIIDGILPQDSQINFFGPSGIGKSFQALDWAIRVALGEPWNGLTVTEGPVIYIVAEGLGMMPDRLVSWWQENKRSLPSSDKLLLYGDAVQLKDVESVLAFHREVRDTLGKVNPSLIIFDTLSQCLIGANENSPEDMSKVNGLLAAFRHNYKGCSTMIVHHTGYEGDHERGHSSLPASAATRIKVDERMGQLVIECEKQRGGREFNAVFVDKVPVGNSLVFLPAAEPAKTLTHYTLNGRHLKILVPLVDNTVGMLARDLQARTSLPERAFLRYKSELEQSQYITTDTQYKSYITELGRQAYQKARELESIKIASPTPKDMGVRQLSGVDKI